MYNQKATYEAQIDMIDVFFTSLAKGRYVFGSVGLSVCLFVRGQHYSKSYERIGMKFYGGILGSTMKT